jgi:hypothetical protein
MATATCPAEPFLTPQRRCTLRRHLNRWAGTSGPSRTASLLPEHTIEMVVSRYAWRLATVEGCASGPSTVEKVKLGVKILA